MGRNCLSSAGNCSGTIGSKVVTPRPRAPVATSPQSNEKQAGSGGGGGGIGSGYPQLRSLFNFMSELLGDNRRRQQLGPVLDQLGEFAREVGCGPLRMLERLG